MTERPSFAMQAVIVLGGVIAAATGWAISTLKDAISENRGRIESLERGQIELRAKVKP